jgi:hypothetical protein
MCTVAGRCCGVMRLAWSVRRGDGIRRCPLGGLASVVGISRMVDGF